MTFSTRSYWCLVRHVPVRL